MRTALCATCRAILWPWDTAYSEKRFFQKDHHVLAPVLESLTTVHQRGVWQKITNIVIPTYNDDMD